VADAKSTSAEELRLVLAQEAERWTDANVDALALAIMIRGIGQRFSNLHAELWTDLYIEITQINRLAATCARHAALAQEQLDTLGVEKPDGAQSQALH
jgi:hypothetical protein